MIEPLVWLGKDDIMRVRYPAGSEIHLATVESETRQRYALRPYPHRAIIYLDGVLELTREARSYLENPDNRKLSRAAAIVVGNHDAFAFLQRYLLEPMRHDNHPHPRKFFDSEEEALGWLAEYESGHQAMGREHYG